MNQIKNYKSLKDALISILQKDKEYRILLHRFNVGKIVKKHFHSDVQEWVVIDEGKFDFFLDDKWHKINAKDKVVVISIPKNTIHAMKVHSKSTYLVIRSGTTKPQYVK